MLHRCDHVMVVNINGPSGKMPPYLARDMYTASIMHLLHPRRVQVCSAIMHLIHPRPVPVDLLCVRPEQGLRRQPTRQPSGYYMYTHSHHCGGSKMTYQSSSAGATAAGAASSVGRRSHSINPTPTKQASTTERSPHSRAIATPRHTFAWPWPVAARARRSKRRPERQAAHGLPRRARVPHGTTAAAPSRRVRAATGSVPPRPSAARHLAGSLQEVSSHPSSPAASRMGVAPSKGSRPVTQA